MSPERLRASGQAARGSALFLTKTTQAVGLALAINEAAIRANARDSVVAFCALCVMGAQVAENVILGLIDRFLQTPIPPPEAPRAANGLDRPPKDTDG